MRFGALGKSICPAMTISGPKKGGVMLRSFALVSSPLVALCLLLSPPAMSQTTTGSILGLVTDPSGAAVPGAEVTVTNEATDIAVIRMITDSSGNYVATTLPPGPYSVSVRATGFKTAV